jgi:hypothetical protein
MSSRSSRKVQRVLRNSSYQRQRLNNSVVDWEGRRSLTESDHGPGSGEQRSCVVKHAAEAEVSDRKKRIV